MLQSELDYANGRGVGQFHLCNAEGRYTGITWRSFETAKAIAARDGLRVYNDSGERVA